jgi:hypothetical protein
MNLSISKALSSIQGLGLARALESVQFASSLASSTFAVKAAKQIRLRLLEVLVAVRNKPELAIYRERIHEALVYQHISSKPDL